jgi:hypothetical protein
MLSALNGCDHHRTAHHAHIFICIRDARQWQILVSLNSTQIFKSDPEATSPRDKELQNQILTCTHQRLSAIADSCIGAQSRESIVYAVRAAGHRVGNIFSPAAFVNGFRKQFRSYICVYPVYILFITMS